MTSGMWRGGARCPDCRQPVIVAVTEHRRRQLLEPGRHPTRDDDENGTGNVAARRDHLGTWWARSLRPGERPAGGEHRYTPHKALCRPPQQPLPGMPVRGRPARSVGKSRRAARTASPPASGAQADIIPLEEARRRRSARRS